MAQNVADTKGFTGEEWEMEFWFAGTASGNANRWMSVILPPNDAVNGCCLINQRIDSNGNLQVFGGFATGLGFQTIASGFDFSVDANEDGVLNAADGDTVNIYHYRIEGFGFGTPNPTYGIWVSDANSPDLVLRGSGIQFFQDTLNVAQDPARPGISGLSLNKQFGAGTGFTIFDDLFLGNPQALPTEHAWVGPDGGDWNNLANWKNEIVPGNPMVPNSAGAFATFGDTIDAPATVNLNAPITVGSMILASRDHDYTISGGNALTLDGTGEIEVQRSARVTEISATIAGSSGITKLGNGVLVLSGNNTFTGDVKIERGRVSVSNDAGLGDASNSIDFQGGELQVTGNTFATTARTMTLGSAGGFDVVEESHTFTVSQTLSGSGGVLKAGLGTLQLSAANTYSGTTRVIDGAIAVNNPSALGDPDGPTTLAGGDATGRLLLNNTGAVAETLNLAGRFTNNAPHIINQAGTNTLSGTLNVTGLDGLIGFTSDAGNLNFGGDLSNDGRDVTLVLGGDGDGEISGVFTSRSQGVTGLTKTGAGTWAITSGSGDSTEQPNGDVLISAGTLEIRDTQTPDQGELAASNITVLAPGTFDVDAFGTYSLQPNQSLGGDGTVRAQTLGIAGDNKVTPGASAGTLTIEGNVTATNDFAAPDGGFVFELSDSNTVGGGVNDLIEVTGNLTLNSGSSAKVTILPIGTTGLANATYRLFNAGSITGGAANLNLINTTRYGMALSTTGTQVDVAVTGSNANITWTGATNSAWDIDDTQNWDNGGADVFFNGDHVTFDDSAGNKTVDVVDSLIPASVTFNNSDGNDYTVGGAGSISGGTGITKNGTGRATISSANDFDGEVSVNAGTLHAASNSALGSTAGGTTVASGATLDVGGAELNEEAVSVSGGGVGGQGAITSSVTSTGDFRPGVFTFNEFKNLRNVTLTGDTTFGADENSRWDIRTIDEDSPATLTGGGFALTKEGAGTVSLTDIGDPDVGDITVNNGTLVTQFTTTLGRAGTATVNAGGELALFSNDDKRPVPTPTKTIVLDGGALGNFGSSEDIDINTPITHSADSGLNVSGSGLLSISTPLTGVGAGITKTGTGTAVLRGSHTYSGNTVVEAGTLQLTSRLPTGGDFNDDGSVNSADFLIWQRGGSPNPNSGGDLAEWKANFGAGGTGGSIANSPLVELHPGASFDVGGYIVPTGQTVGGAGTVSGSVTAGNGTTVDPAAPGGISIVSWTHVQAMRMRYNPDDATGDNVEGSTGLFIGPLRVGDVNRALVEFSFADFPVSAINSVELVITKQSNDGARDEDVTVEAHKLNKSFARGDTTGEFASVAGNDAWSAPGGGGSDFGPLLSSLVANSAEFGNASNPGAQLRFPSTAALLTEVQNAVDTDGSFSILVKVDDANELPPFTDPADPAGSARRNFFRPLGHEAANGPRLEIEVNVFGGILTVDGNYTQDAGSILSIDIGGNGLPGFDYDQLSITGNAAINGGSLDVNLVNSYAPGLGDEFDVLDFAFASGAGFDTFNLPGLGGGLDWDTSNLLTTGILAVVAGGGAGAVPEPSSCLLLLIGAFAAGARRQLRK